MAELIVHNPPRAALKASGYIGSPEGDIELTENDKTYNVTSFASATVKIPEEEKTVTPSAVKQEITPDSGLLSKVTVLPASLEERTVTPTIVQQTITPEAPAIGLSKVTVGATLPPPILVSKQITENGTYAAVEDNADGYSDVTVDVPDRSKALVDSLIDRSITQITTSTALIGGYAFSFCINLTSVTTTHATSIHTAAFDSCNKLIEANINNEVELIRKYAFRNCRSLPFFIMPSKIKTIESYVFHSNTAMEYIDMSNVEAVPMISEDSFGNNSFPFLFRDQGQLDAYANATNWSALADRFQIKGATV